MGPFPKLNEPSKPHPVMFVPSPEREKPVFVESVPLSPLAFTPANAVQSPFHETPAPATNGSLIEERGLRPRTVPGSSDAEIPSQLALTPKPSTVYVRCPPQSSGGHGGTLGAFGISSMEAGSTGPCERSQIAVMGLRT